MDLHQTWECVHCERIDFKLQIVFIIFYIIFISRVRFACCGYFSAQIAEENVKHIRLNNDTCFFTCAPYYILAWYKTSLHKRGDKIHAICNLQRNHRTKSNFQRFQLNCINWYLLQPSKHIESTSRPPSMGVLLRFTAVHQPACFLCNDVYER